MKVLLVVAALFTALASTSDAITSLEESTNVADILRKLGMSSSKEVVSNQDLGDGYDNDDDDDDNEAVAKVMTTALLNSLVEDGEDGENSIMANIMNIDEEEASAQFRFLRRFFRRIRRSPIVRFIGRAIKNKVCRFGK